MEHLILIVANRIFGQITFTPYAGLCDFPDKEWNIKLGEMINI